MGGYPKWSSTAIFEGSGPLPVDQPRLRVADFGEFTRVRFVSARPSRDAFYSPEMYQIGPGTGTEMFFLLPPETARPFWTWGEWRSRCQSHVSWFGIRITCFDS